MNIFGGSVSSFPLMNLPSSRIFFTMAMSWVESMSKTFLLFGSSPNVWWSPERQSMFRIPRAEAPRTSACMAMRFRSRQTIWKFGSSPSWTSRAEVAMLAIRATAVWLSVTLMASTMPLRYCAFSLTASGSAPRGGPSSPVTANLPSLSTRSKLLPDFMFPLPARIKCDYVTSGCPKINPPF